MARKGPSKPRNILPDPIYGSRMVAKLVTRSMLDGKKSVVQKQIYKAFEIIAEKTKEEPLNVFNQALENIKPTMEVRSRRVGGAAYQVPSPVKGPRRDSLGIRWLITAARARSNSEFKSYAEKIAAEIMDAQKGEGSAVKKRQDVERIAEANRAFAHFRW
ncbi:30S ribosomal protein S7 [Candidatus Woesebacteria bacterium RIFCSPHIGHO2_12_FULL_46_16]|uniref:Small ribosomal subunit protein uS7 n=2 Tax=Microgenomates group TaxID=1794810 RepID=A0A1F8B1T0_9BACT|nr:MAG: 30S ribosomal protein S7 [Candidatus Woesebacteria bacterium RIFCSPHIGHO2_12_FULL_46_16]